jgi:hypothetical protein
MRKNTVISLFDVTGNMVRPWAEAGYDCVCVDLAHERSGQDGRISRVKADVLRWLPENPGDIAMMFAFPPCTDVAVSGARWFRDKGLGALIDALSLFKRCVDIAHLLGCPYMLENPVSVVASYWRKPDYSFSPHEFTALCREDNYSKRTCLWTGGGFVMPPPAPDASLGAPDNRILMAPGKGTERASFRSATPKGFAQAVFNANQPLMIQ